ncbi:DNA polymerase III subunit epsilon [Mannheimia sp. AT1]|uniref:DNA polymerase III subunit epsilon n=1 Tax=Mannheimia cairinae TaxID=3025936 RepID=A0ABT5MUL4_9PAST|nr:DNA polymerase III subunit epsilon [Mannheimia cairinae]MDD0824558.1 DNA polymerase III subunit epsilon [Mannheimia cairinae]MDD0825659.1 DNA polymerase III subunit epsilon [Mannheimia cairinae]
MSEQVIIRQVVLDTETTGMNMAGGPPQIGHNIIEIGAVEVVNRRLTGRTYHVYIKPPREVEEEAIQVHGITNEFLQDKPIFAEIADEFLEFIKGAELIIHNAPFDVAFMDQEFSYLPNPPAKTAEMCTVTDSLQMARKMYPGKRNNLDALCDRLGIDNSKRVLHGALLDAEILADVFLMMTGGQISLLGEEETNNNSSSAYAEEHFSNIALDINDAVILKATEEEEEAHLALLKLIDKKSKGNCLWTKPLTEDTETLN